MAYTYFICNQPEYLTVKTLIKTKGKWNSNHPANRAKTIREQVQDAYRDGTLHFTNHARQRMDERRVSAEVFEGVLHFGRETWDHTSGVWHIVGSFFTATVIKQEGHWRVITVQPSEKQFAVINN